MPEGWAGGSVSLLQDIGMGHGQERDRDPKEILTTAPGGPGTPRSPALPGSPWGKTGRVEGVEWATRPPGSLLFTLSGIFKELSHLSALAPEEGLCWL